MLHDHVPIFKNGLAVFTDDPSVTKDQALEETVLILFHPVVQGCFQSTGVIIKDTIAHHDIIKGHTK